MVSTHVKKRTAIHTEVHLIHGLVHRSDALQTHQRSARRRNRTGGETKKIQICQRRQSCPLSSVAVQRKSGHMPLTIVCSSWYRGSEGSRVRRVEGSSSCGGTVAGGGVTLRPEVGEPGSGSARCTHPRSDASARPSEGRMLLACMR
jgi:hypothetical protein